MAVSTRIASGRRRVVTALVRLAARLDHEPGLHLIRNTEGLPNRPGTPREGVVEPFLIADPGGLPMAVPASWKRGREGRLVPVPRGMAVTKVLGDTQSPLYGFGRRGRDTSLGQRGFCAACNTVCPEGPDPCLGLLPGVAAACCGHGRADKAYVVVGGEPDQDVRTIAEPLRLGGEDAIAYFEQQGRTCPRS